MLAVDEQRELDGRTDEQLMELAAEQQRILVTCDVADFPRICRQWLESGKRFGGCAVVVGIRHSEFGAILRALELAFARRPHASEWHDYQAFVVRRR